MIHWESVKPLKATGGDHSDVQYTMQQVKRARTDHGSGRLNVLLSTRVEGGGKNFRDYCAKISNNLRDKEQVIEMNGVRIVIDVKSLEYSLASRRLQMGVTLHGDRIG